MGGVDTAQGGGTTVTHMQAGQWGIGDVGKKIKRDVRVSQGYSRPLRHSWVTEEQQICAELMTPWDRSGSHSLCTACDNAGERAEILPSQGAVGSGQQQHLIAKQRQRLKRKA